MREVINKKQYDTDTARLIKQYFPPLSVNDERYYIETLYQKTTKEYFFAGEGNALSPYGKTLEDGSRIQGKKIRPITTEEAETWLDNYFPEWRSQARKHSGEKTESFTANIPSSLIRKIDAVSIKYRVSKGEALRIMIRAYKDED